VEILLKNTSLGLSNIGIVIGVHNTPIISLILNYFLNNKLLFYSANIENKLNSKLISFNSFKGIEASLFKIIK
jgi:hypothetical protein